MTTHIDPCLEVQHFGAVLEHWSQARPHALAFRFVDDELRELGRRSYAELDARARRIAAHLLERNAAGERVLLMFPPGLEFIDAFMACVYAGLTAVPMPPPTSMGLDAGLARVAAIAQDAKPSALLSTRALLDMCGPALARAAELSLPRLFAVDELDPLGQIDPLDPLEPLDPRATATRTPVVLQYTSGSTGGAKGVVVTHANLLANERAIAQAFGHWGRVTSGVGWLPAHHDMGLFGKLLQTLYVGEHTTLMAPLTFIKRPAAWLRAISKFRGTTSGGPHFAYEMCLRRIRDDELDGVDLSSWRVAFCGAEPIRAATLEAFADRFAAWGFDRSALFPCYGLAEATLMVSGGHLGSTATPLWLRGEALGRDRIEDAAPGAIGSVQVSSCGTTVAGQRVCVVEPESGRALPEDRIGELWVAGPSVAAGYFRREPSPACFAAQTDAGSGPWLRTGDLGFVRGGQVYVTGRRKELLIVRGRNIYPQDIEATVIGCSPELRLGGVAALALTGPDAAEQAVVVVELSRELREGPDRDALEHDIRRAVAAEHGLTLDRVVMVPRRSLPKTTSGKLQRTRTGELLVAGKLGERERPREDVACPYAEPNDYFRRLEGRNTNYRFELEHDVAWSQVDEPGVYFTAAVLDQGGVALDALRARPELHDSFQWALAIGICEEFVALEQRIMRFLAEEREAGRLPDSRSAALFDDEEFKHVQLFRRYADALKAQRPALAAELDVHLQASFTTAWWHDDQLGNYPSAAVYHFVNWLHFVYFEEYSIYLYQALAGDEHEQVQPAWRSAHAAHMREERQHVVTDVAHLERLELAPELRREWSKWFLEQSARDASGLAGLEGVWTWLTARFPEVAKLPQPAALLGNVALRKRAFLRLLTREHGFGHTLDASPGYAAFVRELDEHEHAQVAAASTDAGAPLPGELELRGRLIDLLAAALRRPSGEIDIDQSLVLFGLDSIQAVEIAGELERELGRSLAPTLLFEQPTVRALARALCEGEAPAPSSDDASPRLDVSMFERPRRVLLTGATGFLCSHVLAELLRETEDHVTCLVRADSASAARERVRETLAKYRLDTALADHPRLEFVTGDLARPQLGLDDDAFASLARSTDVIMHGGALVDFVRGYPQLAAVNVDGTHEMLRLAVRGGMLPFNLISTIGIFDTSDQTGEQIVHEHDLPSASAGFRNGYGRSKWAAEQLLSQAAARGLPVRVFRPGIVSGSTKTGAWQPDMVAALIKSFVETKLAIEPSADGCLDAAPVDYVARAIVRIAGRSDTLGGVYHLTNPQPTRWREVYEQLAALGQPLELVDYARWLEHVAATDRDAGLHPYLAYFKARDRSWKLRLPRFDDRNTQAALAGTGITCPRLDTALLGKYLDYFRAVGFIGEAQA